ncbi:T9SS type A sorting domain-containing protein [Polaribacter sp. BAL334]|uniref:T9SS type A sorting domain-containing protein n=1 Tax=Polaribacter sp. BAL334 TaxID=1708178 RepID=UPI0018D25523|nr:T9SS type A sorting domain-containing protein [Polaribacter sp. BAL334]MBG7611515.1 T9SS type A sorting domain-containing protein [Polaribacter sp. BAL334]
MKKNYFLSLLVAIIFSGLSFSQDLIITGIIDGPLPSGYPKGIELYAKNAIADLSIYGLESTTNGAAAAGVEYTFPADAIAAGTFIYISTTGGSAGFLQYLGVTPQYEDGVVNINGDDTVILYKNAVIEDSIGVIGEDGTGKDWDHLDGWAYRKDGKGPIATFDSSEWTFSGANALDGCDKADDTGTNAECSSIFPIGTYKSVASTAPELTIISPKEEELSARTSVDVEFSVSNFNVAAANAGDGYVKYNIDNGASVDLFDTNTFSIPVTPGQAYNLNMELVDNSGNSLSPAVFKNVNFSIAYPCDLNLGAITTTCITSTSATDTYDISIAFTGGNTSTYILATDNGTIGGDNPSTNATGTILISGVTEGTNVVFTVQGDGANSSCDLTRNISSPTCAAFPVVDEFNYTVGANLADQTPWTKVNTGDDMLIAAGNLDFTGLKASTGNKITFDGGGSESYISFADVTSGTVYASFLLKVTDISAMTDVADGGYIASLAGSTSGYDARFWVRPNPDASGTTFDIGFGPESSNPPFTSGTYNVNDVLFVVMAYNKDNNIVSTWINPDASSFEGTIPTATLSSTDTSAPSSINLFILRQDSDGETPFVEIDALRISDNWADVTPKDATASVKNNTIKGFATYPNPVTSDNVTITSNSAENKQVVIFNVLGKKVVSTNFTGTKSDINVANLASGIYILKVTEGTKTATSKLIIK